MTKEEARNVFGGSIVNNLLSLGAEPTNVVRQDGLIEWKSDGYIEVGGVQVWAYYYFEDGEDDDEIYILYKRIIREVFFKMCEDMKVC